jgi:thiol-disulfide isomerase/thioredoxin
MKGSAFLFSLLVASACAFAQSYVKVSSEQLEELLKRKSDTTYVVSFFASWCAPCIQELPDLQAFALEHQAEKVKVILVSLDFEEDASEALIPLMEKYAITQPVWLLVANGNRWISHVDKHWNGSIPATLIFNNAVKKRILLQQRVTRSMLNQQLIAP